MATHRGFTRNKFVDAVGSGFVDEYMSERIGLDGSHGESTEEVVDEILQQQDEITRKRYPFTGCWGGDGGVIEGAEERARYWGSGKEVFRPLDAKDAPVR